MSRLNNSAGIVHNNNPQSIVSKLHCAHCFDSIIEHLNGDAPLPQLPIQFPSEKFPLFVTWKKRSSVHSDWRLRGCIGTFSAKDIQTGLAEYAITSAFHDTRFEPVKQQEIKTLRCDVSLLVQFEQAKHPFDWKIGVHGITIDFSDGSRRYSATYLPDVASEQGWDHATTLNELICKAGFRGVITEKIRQSCNVTRYQSEKAGLTYEEYMTMKQRAAAGHPIYEAISTQKQQQHQEKEKEKEKEKQVSDLE